MILAAGKGTRVQPLTHEMPKPMIPVLGKPIMEYIVEQLAAHSFNDIMVNVSHFPEAIENYFGDGRRWGVNIGYSFEGRIKNGEIIGEQLGSAGGIKRIQDLSGFFDDTFLVVCSDAVFDLDLTAVLRKHWQSGSKASIVVQRVAKERVPYYGVAVCDEHQRITSFQEKPSIQDAKSTLINTGICLFEPEILAQIPSDTVYDIGSQFLPEMIKKNIPFHAIEMPFQWIDVGKLSDYWSANQQLMRGTMHNISMPGKEILPGVWVGLNVQADWANVHIEGPVYIGANSYIEAGCEIYGPTWISHGCYLCGGAKIYHSILFEHTLLRAHGKISEAIVFGKYCVDKEGQPMDSNGAELDWVDDARDRVKA